MTKHNFAASYRVAAALCLFLSSTPSFAQDPQQDSRRPGDANREQAQSAGASEDSSRVPTAGSEPTYQDVLANPDDTDLNYRYAVVQIRKGELRGASATLERVLMVSPNKPSVRLLRALVLYRLDNLQDAQRELETLKGLNLPPDLRATANAYQREIDRKGKRTHFGGRLGLGFEHDTNRNAAPSEGKALFFDVPLQLAGNSLRRADESMIGMAALDARHQLPGPSGHEVYGGYNYFRQDQRLVSAVDLQAHSVHGGAMFKVMGSRLAPSAGIDHVLFARDTFLVNRSLGFNLLRKLSTRLEGTADLLYTYNDFRRTRQSAVLDERSGPEWNLNFGANYEVRPTMRLFTGAGVSEKYAAKDYFNYRRYSATISPTWLLGRGAFLNTALQASFDRYAKSDTVISAKTREDNIYRLRGTLGAPLATSGMLSSLVATLSYEWYHADSSIPNYSYDNTKIMMMMNYRWEMTR